MTSRYSNTKFFRNTSELYENVLEDRGLSSIDQYGTTTFKKLSYSDRRNLAIETHYWQTGDRLEKLASLYYNDATYWWVIARYNQRPTDAHYKPGDLVYIPTPVTLAVSFYTAER